jgi:Domain of unknown function (DUF4440)
MKKALTGSLAVVLACAALPVIAQENQTNKEALKDTLVRLEKESWQAWKNRDGKFYQDFLSDDHVELGAGGRFNKSTVVSFVSSPVCVVKSYSVERFELTVFGENTALLTYHAAQDTTCGDKAVPSPVWISSLYVRRDGKWLNALFQQTAESR